MKLYRKTISTETLRRLEASLESSLPSLLPGQGLSSMTEILIGWHVHFLNCLKLEPSHQLLSTLCSHRNRLSSHSISSQ